jgi:hypothetical protein
MNLKSEIDFFCDLFPIDKAGFLALLMHELAEEAKTTYGPVMDQVVTPGLLRFINELQHRISRFAYQILSEDTTRPADDVVIRMLLTPRPDKAAERVIVNAYRRTLQGFDRHAGSSVILG